MGLVCTKVAEDNCSLLKNYELNCKASGSFGCFTILDDISYNKLLDIADEYGSSIKVMNEHGKSSVSFKEVAEWLNPDKSVNGACKFIIPPINETVFNNSLKTKNFNFNIKDIDNVKYKQIIQGEIEGALSIADAFDYKYSDIINETTYRPLKDGCIFIITIPDDLEFKYTNVDRRGQKCSMLVNEIVLIMNQVCTDDVFNLINNGKIKVNDAFLEKLMKILHLLCIKYI